MTDLDSILKSRDMEEEPSSSWGRNRTGGRNRREE